MRGSRGHNFRFRSSNCHCHGVFISFHTVMAPVAVFPPSYSTFYSFIFGHFHEKWERKMSDIDKITPDIGFARFISNSETIESIEFHPVRSYSGLQAYLFSGFLSNIQA